MTPRSKDLPLLIVTAILCLVMGGIHLAQVVAQTDLYPAPKVRQFYFGFDFDGFYTAALNLRAGKSPYTDERYVTPPIPAVANIPLSYLRETQAALIAAALTFSAVLASYLMMRRIFSSAGILHDLPYLLCTLIIICFSYPFLFLFDRGNIDGFILVLMCLGIYCAGKQDLIAGVLLGVAIAAKAYPVLLMIPLVADRRWRLLGWIGLCLCLLFLVTPHLWIEWFWERVWSRAGNFRATENGSIMCTFYYFGRLVNLLLLGNFDPASGSYVPCFEKIGAGLYLFLLAIVGYVDLRDRRLGDRKEFSLAALAYFPFMVAMPKLAYHYEFVLIPALIPAVCWLWGNATEGSQKGMLLLISLGIALSQFQAIAAERLMVAFLPHVISFLPHFIPGFGLLLVLLGITLLKVQRFGSTKRLRTETRVAMAESP